MKITRCEDMVRALKEIMGLRAEAPREDAVCVYVGDRLVYASYERGETQVLRLSARERLAWTKMIGVAY